MILLQFIINVNISHDHIYSTHYMYPILILRFYRLGVHEYNFRNSKLLDIYRNRSVNLLTQHFKLLRILYDFFCHQNDKLNLQNVIIMRTLSVIPISILIQIDSLCMPVHHQLFYYELKCKNKFICNDRLTFSHYDKSGP